MAFFPLPVLMIGTYDKDENANVMNAAWGGIYDYGKIYISLSKYKTTDNIEQNKAFPVGFATKKTEEISDYFGIASGNKEDKIAKTKVHVTKSNFIAAPIIEEYPLVLECTVDSFKAGKLIGNIINCSVDEDYLDEKGNIDIEKMEIITYDMINNTYRILGKTVGNAFKDGLKLKD